MVADALPSGIEMSKGIKEQEQNKSFGSGETSGNLQRTWAKKSARDHANQMLR